MATRPGLESLKSVRDDVRARLHRLEVGLFACGASCGERASVVLDEAEVIFERVTDALHSDLHNEIKEVKTP